MRRAQPDRCWFWIHSNGVCRQDPYTEPNTPGFYHSVTGTASLIRCMLRPALLETQHEDSLDIDPHWR